MNQYQRKRVAETEHNQTEASAIGQQKTVKLNKSVKKTKKKYIKYQII